MSVTQRGGPVGPAAWPAGTGRGLPGRDEEGVE